MRFDFFARTFYVVRGIRDFEYGVAVTVRRDNVRVGLLLDAFDGCFFGVYY